MSAVSLITSRRAFARLSVPLSRGFSSSGDSPDSHHSHQQSLMGRACCVMRSVQTATPEQLFHYSHYALAGLTPVALALSPSFLAVPVDLALGLAIPYHAHKGSLNIIEDYVPKSQQAGAKFALLVLTGLAGFGLLKVNLCGPGITESVKALWRQPKEVEKTGKDKNNKK